MAIRNDWDEFLQLMDILMGVIYSTCFFNVYILYMFFLQIEVVLEGVVSGDREPIVLGDPLIFMEILSTPD